MNNIPHDLQAVLWSKNVNNLDLQGNKIYIIHQILSSGTWENIKWLFQTYSKSTIMSVFSSEPEKNYTDKSFNFVKNIILEINDNLDKTKYVKTFPRNIR